MPSSSAARRASVPSLVLGLLATGAAIAAPAATPDPAPIGLDQRIATAFQPTADAVSGFVFHAVDVFGHQVPWILGWLIAIALFCTAYFGLINVRGMRQGVRILRGDYAEPGQSGETSHFQALATAVSGTVGLGNIGGVAAAIALGGPGATFWMIIAAFLGMATKFAECTLAVKYRRENPDGTVSGGPMYYLRLGIAKEFPRLVPLAKFLGLTFAVFCLFGTIGSGNFFQVNQAYNQVLTITGGAESFLAGKAWLFGLVMAVAVGVVVIGGVKRIAGVTSKLVPVMAVIYILACLVVIGANVDQLPGAVRAIFVGAFQPEGIAGGAVGVMLVGFRRAAFSNEAGIGSAPIAHASVRTSEPVTEGLVALWEPFVDTVVICTLTALTIIISGVYLQEARAEGVALTSSAFGSVLPWFPQVLAVVVLLFAYSTMISYCYYGTKAANYLFGEGRGVSLGYKLVFLCATLIGVTLDFRQLVDFADAIYFLMAVPNVIGLYMLAPVVKREMKRYFARVRSGEIAPIARP